MVTPSSAQCPFCQSSKPSNPMKNCKNRSNNAYILKQAGKCLAALFPAILLLLMTFLIGLAQTAQALPNNYWYWDPTGNAVTRPTDGNGNWDDTTVSNW